jgi:hypothetical protein
MIVSLTESSKNSCVVNWERIAPEWSGRNITSIWIVRPERWGLSNYAGERHKKNLPIRLNREKFVLV